MSATADRITAERISTALAFGMWMGTADRHAENAAVHRAMAKSPLLSAEAKQAHLVAAYAEDAAHDRAIQQATAWASRR